MPERRNLLSVVLDVWVVLPWSKEYLERDVRTWIESPGSLVSLAITMFIDLSWEPRSMSIENWEPYPSKPDDDSNSKKKRATPTDVRPCH